MKKIIFIILIPIIAIGISTYAYFSYVGKDYSKDLFIVGKNYFETEKFREAYYCFKDITEHYKASKYFEDSRILMEESKKQADMARVFEIAMMNFKHNNFKRAQSYFNYIIQNFPNSKYYNKAVENEIISRTQKKIQNDFEDAELSQKVEDYQRAISKYKKIINDYPSSIYADESRKNLGKCVEEYSKITAESEKEYEKRLAEKNRLIADEIFLKANEYLANNEYFKALKNYQKIISTYPQSDHVGESKERAGRVMIIINDVESKRLFFEGKKLIEAGKIEKALEKYNMVVKVYPNTEIYFRAREELSLGQSLFGKVMFEDAKQQLDKGNKNEGTNILKTILTKYPNTQWAEQAKFQLYLLQATGIARELLTQANDLYVQKEYAKAAEIFEKIVRNYPDNQQLLESAKSGLVKSTAAQSFVIAENFFKNPETEKDALEKYNAIARDFPSTEWAEMSINRIKEYNEREAEKIFKVAEDIFRKQDYELAISNYQNVIVRYPSTTFANKAKETIEKSKTKIFEVRFNKIFENYTSKERFDEAIAAYKGLIKDAPDLEWKIKIEDNISKAEDGIISRMISGARDLYNQEKYKEAIAYYEMVIKQYPKKLKYIDEAKKNISMINSESLYKKITENLELQQFAVVARSFNQLKNEKFAGDWTNKAQNAIEPYLQKILEKGFDFLTKQYFDYSLEIFKLITENYPQSTFMAKAKEGIFKVNLNKPGGTVPVAPTQQLPPEQKK